MNKAIIIGGAVLLVVTGGAFLYLAGPSTPSMPEEEYSTTPTQWSQAGDYKIEETAEGTVVTNEKAGFSFEVPEGWSVEEKGEEPEFWLSLLSQDAQFDENGFFVGGCGINVETLEQEIEVTTVTATIQSVKEQPAEFENKSIVTISNYEALRTEDIPTSQEILAKIGERVRISLPIDQTTSINLVTQLLPQYKDRCNQHFEDFLSQIAID